MLFHEQLKRDMRKLNINYTPIEGIDILSYLKENEVPRVIQLSQGTELRHIFPRQTGMWTATGKRTRHLKPRIPQCPAGNTAPSASSVPASGPETIPAFAKPLGGILGFK